jgi:RNA polymerase sigma factor (sigma-70 family)
MSAALNDGLPSFSTLLSAIRAGDEDAIGVFVRHYEPQLRRVLRVTKVIRLLQSQIDSQGLVQSTFIQVIADIRAERVSFRDREHLEAYLKTVGRNRLRDAIRRIQAAKRDRQRTVGSHTGELAQLVQRGPSPSQVAELREQVARVEACTSPSELQLIKERIDGAGWQELAAARGLSAEALRKRIERVRRRIRQALSDPEQDTSAEDR